jgi:hypothetical protein
MAARWEIFSTNTGETITAVESELHAELAVRLYRYERPGTHFDYEYMPAHRGLWQDVEYGTLSDGFRIGYVGKHRA